MLADDYAHKIDTQAQKDQYTEFIIYGSLLGFFSLGFYTDFLARRSLYTLLAVLISFELTLILIQTIYQGITRTEQVFVNKYFAVSLLGYFYAVITTMIMQQLPLYIAGRYRDLNSAWELPLAGQMLATVQVWVLWLPVILAQVILRFFYSFFPKQYDSATDQGRIGSKILILLLMATSIFPLYPLLRFECA